VEDDDDDVPDGLIVHDETEEDVAGNSRRAAPDARPSCPSG
jgi:hypothetical protein